MHLGGVNKLAYWSPLWKGSYTCYYWFFFFWCHFFSNSFPYSHKRLQTISPVPKFKWREAKYPSTGLFLWLFVVPSLSLFCYFSFWIFIWRYASIGYSKWPKNWGLYIWHNSWWCCASQHRWSGTCFVLVRIVAYYSCVLNIFLTWHSKSLHRFLPMEYWFLVTLSQLMKQVWSQLMNQVWLELEGERLWAFLPILYFELIFIILFFVFKEYFFQVRKDSRNPFLFSGFKVADGSGTMLVK